MAATHHSQSRLETDRLRRYVLDSLASGHPVSVHCSHRAGLDALMAIGTRFGSQPSITRSTQGWDVKIEAGTGCLDLYNLH